MKKISKKDLVEWQKEFNEAFGDDECSEDILYNETKEGRKRAKYELQYSDNVIISHAIDEQIDDDIRHFSTEYTPTKSSEEEGWGIYWSKENLDRFLSKFKPNPKSKYEVHWRFCKGDMGGQGYYELYTTPK